jgi:iron(III) transport system substrate-binding protein
MRALRLLTAATAALVLAGGLAACGDSADPAAGSDPDALVIYSGRNERLVGPLLEQLEDAVGRPVEVRYAASAELAAQLLEEGERTPADVFFSQDAGALGALAKAGMLQPLEVSPLDMVDERYRDSEDRWVATSARARVLAYDPRQVSEEQLPEGVDGLLDPRYQGKIGIAPTNASFQSFVTALRVERGEDGARQWLEQLVALEPQVYDNNIAVLDAVDGGQVALGLINHYYWYERVGEVGADAVTARIDFFRTDDPGALVNVAGVGVLAATDAPEDATAVVEFLLSETAQQYFADETAEYPVIPGISSTEHDLPPLAEIDSHQIDLNSLDSLEQTLVLLDEVGLT